MKRRLARSILWTHRAGKLALLVLLMLLLALPALLILGPFALYEHLLVWARQTLGKEPDGSD
jgi:hypothetical protein